jgi:protein O-mannosyl-transferase
MTERAPKPAVLRLTARAVLLASLLLVLLVYLPGMSGGFVFDDYANILVNDDLKGEALTVKGLLEAGWSGMAGPLRRPLAMMSFALNYATTGDFVAGFKLTNLVIHLVNGVLLFVLLRLILSAHSKQTGQVGLNLPMVAAVAAAIWLLHPLNLTSVLYIVQRMTSLSAMFSLAAMICYCAGRRRLEGNGRGGWWLIGGGVPGFTALGLLSKENAALTIPLIALIEVCFFRLRTHRPRDRTLLISLFVPLLVLPVVAALVYLIANPDFLAGRYAGRPFTLGERLFTEARVLWFYLSLLLVPRLSRFGLHHDDYQLSTSAVDPATTGIALGGIAIAIILAAVALRRRPLVTFAIGWYLIGHALESSIIPLELVHEHRNYLPGMGVIFALSYATAVLFQRHRSTRLLPLLSVVIVILCATVTFIRAGDWSDPVTLAVVEAERHPNSFRAVYELARIQFGLYKLTRDERDYHNAVVNLERSAALDGNAKRPLAALLKLEYARGRAPKPEWKAELLRRYEFTLFHESETQDLHQIVKCRAERTCNFPQQEVVELYQAALANSTIPTYSKAQLMVDLAIFYVNEAGDLVPAMNLLDAAVELHPKEFGFRKVRAQIYVVAGRYDEVDDEIRYLRTVSVWRDRLNSPVAAIDGLERQLREARRRDDGAQ